MPTFSERATLLKGIERLMKLMILYNDDDSEDEEEFEDMVLFYESISSRRYVKERVPIPKSLEFCNAIFNYPDDAFRTIARCSKASFHRLVSKIKNHQVFNNNSKMKQASVETQLLIVLNRLGCDGNGASIDRTGLFFGRSVGTVEKFTDRIFEAILSLEKDYVFWPDAAERSAISERMDINHGLKHAVGIVDGTPVNFYQKPGIDGETYFNRKGR